MMILFQSNLWRSITVILFLFVLFSGCTAPDPKTTVTVTVPATLMKSTNAVSPSPSVTAGSVHSPTSTDLSTPTASPTAKPTNTKIPTITLPAPTWTPQPTLELSEARALAVELLETNAGCRLPCWWGFTPGKTPWIEAKAFLEKFDSEIYIPFDKDDPIIFADVRIPVPEYVYYTDLNQRYIVENGIISAILAHTGNIQTYYLSSFLMSYDSPKEIWISTYSTEYPLGVLPFMISLFYPEQGILATYFPNQTSIQGGTVRACQVDVYPSDLWLWKSDQEKNFMEVARESHMNPDAEGFLLLPIEEATQMDVEMFYQTYIHPNSPTCIETPKELWPEQL